MMKRKRIAMPRANDNARKILRMLLAFSLEFPRLRLDELARIAATPKSSAYRHLSLLREMGLVEDDGRGVYQLSTRIVRLAEAARAADGTLDAARPIMERLRDQSRETVLLYKRVREKAVCIELFESFDPIRLSSFVGATLPLHRGAGARLLLAHRRPGRTATSAVKSRGRKPSRLKDAVLERIRREGYAVSVGEISPEVWAVAAPVFDGKEVGYSLTIAGPAYRLDEARQRRLTILVRRAAARLSHVLAQ